MTMLRFRKLHLFNLLVLLGCAVNPVMAQEPDETTIERVVVERQVSPDLRIGAISIISTGGEPPDLSQMETVTFNVPVEDIPYYKYYVGKIKDSGAGWSGARPDEYGVIEQVVNAGSRIVERVSQVDVNGTAITRINESPPKEGEFEYYYLFAHDTETGDVFYTFDISQVPLYAVLHSMASSLSAGIDPRERLGMRPSERVQGITEENRNTFLSLLGEKMSLEETLDRIYQSTGCAVFRQEYSLLIDYCD